MFPRGGEPPDEDRSELPGGERDRLSTGLVELSSHCCAIWGVSSEKREAGRSVAHSRKGSAYRLVLERGLGDAERIVLGLGGNRRGR